MLLDIKNKMSVCLIFSVLIFFAISLMIDLENIFPYKVSINIFLSIITALATTAMISLVSFVFDYKRIKQYIGVWQIMKYGSEDYESEFAYVEIGRISNEELSYKYKHTDNFQIMEGIIYINKNSKDNGKLISRYEHINFQSSKFYPINEKTVYFDRKLSVGENVSPIIRVLNLNGLENFILVSPDNQINFKEKLEKRYKDNFDECIYQQGLPVLDLSSIINS